MWDAPRPVKRLRLNAGLFHRAAERRDVGSHAERGNQKQRLQSYSFRGMNLFELRAFGAGIALPALVAAICVWMTLRRREHSSEHTVKIASNAGISLGFLAAYAALGWAPLIPKSPWQWLPYLAVTGAAVSIGGIAFSFPKYIAWLGRIAVALFAASVLLPRWLEPLVHPLAWPAILGAVIVAMWFALALESNSSNNRSAFFLAGIMATGAAVLMESGNAKLAQLAVAAAASVGGAWVLSKFWANAAAVYGSYSFASVVLPALLVEGYWDTYSKNLWPSFLLVIVAPFSWSAAALLLRDKRRSGQLWGEWLAAGLPCVIALALIIALASGEGLE